ncbi:hypothetical protein CERSUDRAFT_97437 [Gelatoporia subvermispora B]|uniref:F-box domain-containing protein n=1 Tax=Ceriporiopsis subvermispora (strain B) TaxID=914234 RepID=M2QCW2_CERS8|nr:hypothetical protein CERSUDRAFT_97437 [Gelatoporia subvermispora B]
MEATEGMGGVCGHNRAQFASPAGLNDDILHYLMWFLDSNELLALMMTCHALYSTGIPIVVDDYFRLEAFCDFMHCDLAHRTRCLKRLKAYILLDSEAEPDGCSAYEANPSEGTMQRFIQVLYNAVSLERLDITLNACTLQLYPEPSRALRRLPSIRALCVVYRRVDDIKDIIEPVLGMLPLDTLRFTIDTLDDTSAKMLHQSRSSSALHQLTVERFDISTPVSIQFPRLEYSTSNPELHVSTWRGDMDNVRAHNMLVRASSPTWRELKVVSGNLEAIYAMALECELTRLETRLSCGFSPHMFWTLLADTRPRKLLLYVNWWIASELHRRFTQDDLSSFKTVFLNTPETLNEVTLQITLDETTISLKTYLAHIVDMCEPLKVAKLGISLDRRGLPISARQGRSARFAQELAEHITTLSEFTLVLPLDTTSPRKLGQPITSLSELEQHITSKWKIERRREAAKLRSVD